MGDGVTVVGADVWQAEDSAWRESVGNIEGTLRRPTMVASPTPPLPVTAKATLGIAGQRVPARFGKRPLSGSRIIDSPRTFLRSGRVMQTGDELYWISEIGSARQVAGRHLLFRGKCSDCGAETVTDGRGCGVGR